MSKKNDDGFRGKLVAMCKYFKDEKENPFKVGETAALWWDGERDFVDKCTTDPTAYSRILASYNEALNAGEVSGRLKNKDVPECERALTFYLDIWHGAKYPYDDLNLIQTY